MSKYRKDARVDNNQKDIVENLEKIPGIKVATGHDDILVGFRKMTFWFEVKNPETAFKKNGELTANALKKSQKKLLNDWSGHYSVVSTVEEILKEIGIKI